MLLLPPKNAKYFGNVKVVNWVEWLRIDLTSRFKVLKLPELWSKSVQNFGKKSSMSQSASSNFALYMIKLIIKCPRQKIFAFILPHSLAFIHEMNEHYAFSHVMRTYSLWLWKIQHRLPSLLNENDEIHWPNHRL